MPTYEYRCSNGHHFEQFQRMSEPPIERCPTCGAPAERLLSAGAGLLFKGSGFYITDYGKDGKKDQRKAAESNKGEGGSSGGESKPAPAADKTPSKGSGSSES